ncbi:hypothetical protein J7J62_03905 [bacterium]|nr:hypothetical protein [bacterium]
MSKLEIRKKSHKYIATIQRERSSYTLNLEIEVNKDYMQMKGTDNLSTEVGIHMNVRFIDAFVRLLQEINEYCKTMTEDKVQINT